MKNSIKELFKVSKESIKEILLWLIGGFLLLITTEFWLRGKWKYVKLLFLNKTGVFFVNYFLILMITSLIFLVKRKKTFYFLTSVIILTISAISKYLYIVRGVPFTFSDLYSIGEGMEIASNYISIKMVLGIVIGVILFLVVFIYLFKIEKNNKRINSLLNVVLIPIVIVLFICTLNEQYNNKKMAYMRWDITASYKRNGYIYSTIESGLKYIRSKPKDYSKKSIDEIRAKVDKKESQDTRIINKEKPNILFVQLEAFMDPLTIKEAIYSEDPVPNFRKVCEKTKGYMANVPTTGGGTVRTEYEVMTGNNIDYLTPGEIPNNTILKGKYYNSVATTLKEQGYTAHAIHNFQGNFYTRNNAYSKLGFDTFTSIEYMNDYEKNERGWVKDNILTKYIQKALNSTQKQDLVYTISVQGHSSYPTDSIKKYDFPIKVDGNLSEIDKNQLYYYVNQIKGTDDFIGDLIEMIDNMDEKTLLVLYSDHMPALNLFKNEKFYLDAYEAPFAFYSNYEIDNFDFDKIQSYNISTLAMQLAGVEYGPMEKLHAYLGDDKNYEKYEQLVEYDLLFGKNYYLKDEEKPSANTIKMGIDDVVINHLEKNNEDEIFIKGQNFTINSVVYINKKKVAAEFVDTNTLKIKGSISGDTLVVKQLGRNDGLLSQSNELLLNETMLAKK